MKPTLSNIERRIESLEKSRPTSEPQFAVIRYIGAPEPDYYMETSMGMGRNGAQEVFIHWPIYIHSAGKHSEDAPDVAPIGGVINRP